MRILNTVSVVETPFLNMRSTTYEDRDGQLRNWIWVERPKTTNAVMIAGVTDDQKLVVIKEFRIPLQGFEYGFPAGLINPGENIEETADRELQEEAGYKIKTILKTSPLVYNTAGLSNEGLYILFANVEPIQGGARPECMEEIETLTLTREEVKDLLMDPKNMIGAKSWLIFDNFVRNQHL
jgi:ADP-ribose pyrophosphatase